MPQKADPKKYADAVDVLARGAVNMAACSDRTVEGALRIALAAKLSPETWAAVQVRAHSLVERPDADAYDAALEYLREVQP